MTVGTPAPGRLHGVGVGPGDPELMTVKAARLIQGTTHIAYFAARGRPSNARAVAAGLLGPGHVEHRIDYPVTVETLGADESYETLLLTCYDEAAERIEALLGGGEDVVVLCEGDPFFYGSYMYIHNRLAERFDASVVPGVPSPVAGAAALSRPLVCGNEVLSVLSGVLGPVELVDALAACDAAVIIKLGRNLAKVRAAVERAGLLDRAFYVERASSAAQVCCPLAEVDPATAPYFSMVVVPSAMAWRR